MNRRGIMTTKAGMYGALMGVFVGMLIAGLLVPVIFGDVPGGRQEPGQDVAGVPQGGVSGGLDGVSDERPSDSEGVSEEGPSGGFEGEERGGQGGASAVGVGRGNDGETGSAREEEEAGERTASDRGITKERLKLGILILDLGSLGDVGVASGVSDAESQEEAWRVFVDDINSNGGIVGREVTPVFARYDILDHDDMRAACLELTEDAEVFAVLDASGYWGPGVRCIAAEHRTPFLYSGSVYTPNSYYEAAEGMLFSLSQRASRMLRNFANELHVRGELKGKTIGVMSDEDPGAPRSIEEFFLPTLRELGYSVEEHAVMSADRSTGSSQVPLVVNRMRASGVDSVLFVTNLLYLQQFAQEAEQQQYFPDYYVTDWHALTSDTATANAPDSFDGAIGITDSRTNEERMDLPEPEHDAVCRRVYEEATGTDIGRSSDEYAFVSYCGMLRIFREGTERGKPNVTRNEWSGRMQGLGEQRLPSMAPGAFQPGKFDAADRLRALEWEVDCSCWLPKDEFRVTDF